MQVAGIFIYSVGGASNKSSFTPLQTLPREEDVALW